MSPVHCSFTIKRAYSEEKHTYMVPSVWSVRALFGFLARRVPRDFGLYADSEAERQHVEFARGGQPEGERAPAIKLGAALLDAPVLRIFQPVNHWYMRITRAPAPRAIAGQNQCPVCLESRAVLQHHECVHAVCAPCFAACITHSRDACPLCRAPLALMQSP